MPLWPWPLLLAAVPTVGIAFAWFAAMAEGYLPACNPFVEGCTTISRTGRQGTAYYLFKIALGPTAGLYLVWAAAAGHWARTRLQAPRTSIALLVLGYLAAVALAVYSAYLGSQGPNFAVYRRLGASTFFATAFLSQLLLYAAWARHARRRSWEGDGAARRSFGCLVLLQLALGLVSLPLTAWAGPEMKDYWENVIEWWFAAALAAAYLPVAWAWRHERVQLRAGGRVR